MSPPTPSHGAPSIPLPHLPSQSSHVGDDFHAPPRACPCHTSVSAASGSPEPDASLPSQPQTTASLRPLHVTITYMGLANAELPKTSLFPLSHGLAYHPKQFTLGKGVTQIKDPTDTSLSLGEERNYFHIRPISRFMSEDVPLPLGHQRNMCDVNSEHKPRNYP